MSQTTLNISLPESMRRFVEEKISNEGYGTISEYVRDLIRADQRKEQARFDALIAQALKSGEPSPLTKADVEKARQIFKKRTSPSEVGHEVLRLSEELERAKEMARTELRAEIQKGRDQIRSGNYIEIKSSDELDEFADRTIRRGREKITKRKRTTTKS